MTYNSKILGNFGEREACEYLISEDYKIIERNYTNFFGEIDIIAISPDKNLVFIEVKTRSNKKYGYAFEAVNYKKREKILKISMIYIKDNDLSNFQPRYDIIEVYSRDKMINHIKNAFGF